MGHHLLFYTLTHILVALTVLASSWSLCALMRFVRSLRGLQSRTHFRQPHHCACIRQLFFALYHSRPVRLELAEIRGDTSADYPSIVSAPRATHSTTVFRISVLSTGSQLCPFFFLGEPSDTVPLDWLSRAFAFLPPGLAASSPPPVFLLFFFTLPSVLVWVASLCSESEVRFIAFQLVCVNWRECDCYGKKFFAIERGKSFDIEVRICSCSLTRHRGQPIIHAPKSKLINLDFCGSARSILPRQLATGALALLQTQSARF